MIHNDKVLVVGGSSFLGKEIVAQLGDERAVWTSNTTPCPGSVPFDALSMRLSDAGIDLGRISHAVLLFGMTSPDACARQPGLSSQINEIRMKSVIDDLREAGTTIVFTSSEVVFDGARGVYTEQHQPNPILLYGRQKLAVENYIRETCGYYLTVRLARIFGSRQGDQTLITGLMERIANNEVLKCADDQLFSPVHVTEAAKGIVNLMQQDQLGLFHLGGLDTVSPFIAAETLLSEFRNSGGRFSGDVGRYSIRDFQTVEPRPLNVTLNSDKFVAATGFEFRPFRYWCKDVVNSYAATHSDRSTGHHC